MRRNLLIALAAIAFGLAAAFVATTYLKGARTEIANENQPVQVLVAQQDLPQGMSAEELMAKKYVKLEEVPRRFVSRDAVSSQRPIENQVLAVPVSKGDQLTLTRFTFASDAGLSYSVPDNLVAITVDVDDVTGVAGMLKPGDSVIVFASFKPEGGLSAARTETLIPKARVLATGSQLNVVEQTDDGEAKSGGVLGGTAGKTAAYGTVTLALSADDAARVAFARQHGAIQLALLAQTAPDGDPPHAIVFGRPKSASARPVTE